MLRHLRGDGDASCSHIKEGNRRALCAGNAGVVLGGFTKGRKRHEKVRHNGVGNENFALGFPRTHRMAKMREGGIFYHRLLPSRGRQGDISLWEGDPPASMVFPPYRGSFLILQLPGVSHPFWGVVWAFSSLYPSSATYSPHFHAGPYGGAGGLEDAAGCSLCSLKGILGCRGAERCLETPRHPTGCQGSDVEGCSAWWGWTTR